jgi:hypothetical protein
LKNKIETYLGTNPRNKIIIHQNPLLDITSLNLGCSLSKSISHFKSKKRLPLQIISTLQKELNKSITFYPNYGQTLAITNIGILFEPELKININTLFDEFSKNNALFVEWKGSIENTTLFFLNNTDRIKINLNTLSHIIL